MYVSPPPPGSAAASLPGNRIGWSYFVHYSGWNVRWDEWVAEADLLKDTAESRAMAQLLKSRKSASGKKGGKDGKSDGSDASKKDGVGGVPGGGNDSALPLSKREQLEQQRKRERMQADDAAQRQAKYLRTNNLVFAPGAAGGGGGAEGSVVASYNALPSSLSLKVALPFVLKKVLVDDWEQINGGDIVPDGDIASSLPGAKKAKDTNGYSLSRKVVDLPVKVTVRMLFDQFLKEKEAALKGDDAAVGGAPPPPPKSAASSSSSSSSASSAAVAAPRSAADVAAELAPWKDFAQGIMHYFERSLPVLLLYKAERTQYESFRAAKSSSISSSSSSSFSSSSSSGAAPSQQALVDVYGMEHLLRLFVKLPYIVSSSAITEGEARALLSRIGEVLKHMQKNVGPLQSGRYREPRGGEWCKGEEDRMARDAAKERARDLAEARAVKEVELAEAMA